jgi:plastocyanin
MRTTHTPSRRPRIRPLLVVVCCLALILAVGGLVAACGGSTSTSTTAAAPGTTAGGTPSTTAGTPSTTAAGGATEIQVAIKGFAFNPAEVTINVGDTVTWTNDDSANHTVVADNGEFKSGDLGQGATFSFTFTKAGTYQYKCGVHPNMTGTVTVK